MVDQIFRIGNFMVDAFLHIWPYLVATIPLAVAVQMSGASKFIKRAFNARPLTAILLATIVGAFSGTATFGSITLSSGGGGSMFVARLDSKGKYLWVVPHGATNYYSLSGNHPHAVAVDSKGNATITGWFRDQAVFGSTTLTAAGKLADLFVARLDSKGTFLWAVSAGGQRKEP